MWSIRKPVMSIVPPAASVAPPVAPPVASPVAPPVAPPVAVPKASIAPPAAQDAGQRDQQAESAEQAMGADNSVAKEPRLGAHGIRARASIKDEVLDRDRHRDETGTWSTDTMQFQDDELSYALGKQGGTRKKLERSSGAVVQYVGQTALFSGTKAERKRAKEYMKWLFMQLEGPVWVDNWEDRDDITVLDIPSDCIGYVTGSRRAALGGMEEEWGTLMFFMTKPGTGGGKGDRRGGGFGEQLAILGPERGRRGAELKVMSSVEEKAPGQYTRGIREKFSDSKGFSTDRMIFKDDELSYALGKQGSTRKKLALASGCIIQYVGHVCFLAGTMAERRRAKEFLDWLLQQRRGQVTVNNIAEREDVTEVHVPENCKGWVTGNRGSELRRMELETGTYMFMALDKRGEEGLGRKNDGDSAPASKHSGDPSDSQMLGWWLAKVLRTDWLSDQGLKHVSVNTALAKQKCSIMESCINGKVWKIENEILAAVEFPSVLSTCTINLTEHMEYRVTFDNGDEKLTKVFSTIQKANEWMISMTCAFKKGSLSQAMNSATKSVKADSAWSKKADVLRESSCSLVDEVASPSLPKLSEKVLDVTTSILRPAKQCGPWVPLTEICVHKGSMQTFAKTAASTPSLVAVLLGKQGWNNKFHVTNFVLRDDGDVKGLLQSEPVLKKCKMASLQPCGFVVRGPVGDWRDQVPDLFSLLPAIDFPIFVGMDYTHHIAGKRYALERNENHEGEIRAVDLTWTTNGRDVSKRFIYSICWDHELGSSQVADTTSKICEAIVTHLHERIAGGSEHPQELPSHCNEKFRRHQVPADGKCGWHSLIAAEDLTQYCKVPRTRFGYAISSLLVKREEEAAKDLCRSLCSKALEVCPASMHAAIHRAEVSPEHSEKCFNMLIEQEQIASTAEVMEPVNMTIFNPQYCKQIRWDLETPKTSKKKTKETKEPENPDVKWGGVSVQAGGELMSGKARSAEAFGIEVKQDPPNRHLDQTGQAVAIARMFRGKQDVDSGAESFFDPYAEQAPTIPETKQPVQELAPDMASQEDSGTPSLANHTTEKAPAAEPSAPSSGTSAPPPDITPNQAAPGGTSYLEQAPTIPEIRQPLQELTSDRASQQDSGTPSLASPATEQAPAAEASAPPSGTSALHPNITPNQAPSNTSAFPPDITPNQAAPCGTSYLEQPPNIPETKQPVQELASDKAISAGNLTPSMPAELLPATKPADPLAETGQSSPQKLMALLSNFITQNQQGGHTELADVLVAAAEMCKKRQATCIEQTPQPKRRKAETIDLTSSTPPHCQKAVKLETKKIKHEQMAKVKEEPKQVKEEPQDMPSTAIHPLTEQQDPTTPIPSGVSRLMKHFARSECQKYKKRQRQKALEPILKKARQPSQEDLDLPAACLAENRQKDQAQEEKEQEGEEKQVKCVIVRPEVWQDVKEHHVLFQPYMNKQSNEILHFILSCDDGSRSLYVGKGQITKTEKFPTNYQLDKAKTFSNRSFQKQIWKKKIGNGVSVYVLTLSDLEVHDKPNAVKVTYQKYRNRSFFMPESLLLSCDQLTMPAMSLYSTSRFFLDLLNLGDLSKLKDTAMNLDGYRLRVGSTCSGTDIGIVALKSVLRELNSRHVFSAELDSAKRDYILSAFEDCEHVFGDVICFSERSGYCYRCQTVHKLGSDFDIDYLLCGPSCKDISGLASGSSNIFVDTASSIDWGESALDVATCLTPTHCVYSVALKRYLTPTEHLSLQGIWRTDAENMEVFDELCRNPRLARDFAGNSFSATVCQASFIASLIACDAWREIGVSSPAAPVQKGGVQKGGSALVERPDHTRSQSSKGAVVLQDPEVPDAPEAPVVPEAPIVPNARGTKRKASSSNEVVSVPRIRLRRKTTLNPKPGPGKPGKTQKGGGNPLGTGKKQMATLAMKEAIMAAYDQAVEQGCKRPVNAVKKMKGYFPGCVYESKWGKIRRRQCWSVLVHTAPRVCDKFKELPNSMRKILLMKQFKGPGNRCEENPEMVSLPPALTDVISETINERIDLGEEVTISFVKKVAGSQSTLQETCLAMLKKHDASLAELSCHDIDAKINKMVDEVERFLKPIKAHNAGCHPQLIANFDQVWTTTYRPSKTTLLRKGVSRGPKDSLAQSAYLRKVRHSVERMLDLNFTESDPSCSRKMDPATPVIQGSTAAKSFVDGWRLPRTLTTLSFIDGHVSRGYVTYRAGTISTKVRDTINMELGRWLYLAEP
eukprot:s787_g14.t1